MSKPPVRVVFYTRVSTEEQAKHGSSLETQEEEVLRLCDQRGWEIVGGYSDPGISGATIEARPGVKSLIEDSTKGDFELVLVTNLDRLSRDTADLWSIISQFRDNKVGIATTTLPDINSLQKEFYLAYGGPAGQAQYDRELRHARQLEGIKRLKQEGRHYGPAPHGFVVSKEGFLEPTLLAHKAMKLIVADSEIAGKRLQEELGLKTLDQAFKLKRAVVRHWKIKS